MSDIWGEVLKEGETSAIFTQGLFLSAGKALACNSSHEFYNVQKSITHITLTPKITCPMVHHLPSEDTFNASNAHPVHNISGESERHCFRSRKDFTLFKSNP